MRNITAQPLPSKPERITPHSSPREPAPFDAEADVWAGVQEAYRVIRERKANGGRGWGAS